MNKDELLGHLDFIEDQACDGCGGHGGTHCEICEKSTKAVRSILTQHFSITEQERKEALEWIKGRTTVSVGYNKGEPPHHYQTILKALGGLE